MGVSRTQKLILKPAWGWDLGMVLRRLPEKVQAELRVGNVEERHPRQRKTLQK